MVNYDEAFEKSLEYFGGSKIAANVFLSKYAIKTRDGEILESTPDDMHKRLAKELARIEAKYPNGMDEEEIYGLLKNFKKIIPQGSPLSGIGNEHQIQSISNCFVIETGDSYGAILKSDEEMAQIFKRRGGCMEENSKVFSDKGLQTIKEIVVGQKILSYNIQTKKSEFKHVLDKFETKVLKENRIILKTKTGIQIKSSNLHPILTISIDTGELLYKKAGEIKVGDCLIQPENNLSHYNPIKNTEDADYGWFIGAHIGDGTAGKIKTKYKTKIKSWKVDRIRLRILGDNEKVVEHYGRIANTILNSKGMNSFKSRRKNYKTIVWEYGIQTIAVENLVNKFFDGQIGKKVYTAKTSNFIKENNLWIPYIAGLIDTDGYIRAEGTINISICAKMIIDDISSWLSAMGVRANVTTYYPKRPNEKPIYKLSINDHNHQVVKDIMQHVVHEIKKQKFENSIGREWSKVYPLTILEKENILKIFNNGKYKNNFSQNLLACIGLLRKRNFAGIGALNVFNEFKLINKNDIENIKQRTIVIEISKDEESQIYYDLSIENNNNYYSGNFGLVVDHNCGLDISPIRPKGLTTSNAAKTTDGITSFMERFSSTCREVATNGRRAALMQTISVHHPEISTFINIKKDLKKVTGANISIRLSDEFMNAVKNDSEYEQRWPVDSITPKVSKMVKAKEIWDEIVDAARNSSEPGLLFWNNVIKNSPADCYAKEGYTTRSTNPCQPGWATLLTPNGIRTFDQIKIGDTIWSGKQWTKVINKVSTGIKPVYAFKTRAGIFNGTDNHRVVSGGKKIEARLAKSIDLSVGSIESLEKLNPQDIMDGLVMGDGSTHKASNSLIILYIGKDDQCYFESEIKDLIIENRVASFGETAWTIKTEIKDLPKTFDRSLTKEWITSSSPLKIRGFLRGLYSANGSVVSNRITLKSTSLKLVEQVQELLSMFGIQSNYTVNKPTSVEFENGIYECKKSYDLNIGTRSARIIFEKLIGFIHPTKQGKLLKTLGTKPTNRKTKVKYDIMEKEYLGEEEVYDITVDAPEHTYWTGCLHVSNCAELPLSLNDSCRLLVINAMGYVKNPFSNKAQFDWKEFEKDAIKAQRLMDDIVDLEEECINKILSKIESDPESDEVKRVEKNLWTKIKAACVNGRRTGLGPTAIGDMLAALNIKYGSEESITFVGHLYRTLALASYKSSVIMAKERGAFPVFSHEVEKDNIFLKRIWDADSELYKEYLKYGRRNIANLTTAPVGSCSLMANLMDDKFETTSGIECAYLISYKRRKKINSSDQNTRVDFIDDMGDKWQEFQMFHSGFKAWMEVNNKTEADIEQSPYWKATALEVDWINGVKLQAAAQKWVDHAISRTQNLPNDVTVDIVSEIYMSAWEQGCKGYTIYRDGSRSGVLISNEEKTLNDKQNTSFSEHHAPKRPTELPCDVYHPTVQGEKWTVFVGLLDGKPYEVMGGLAKHVKLPKRVKSGKIVKHNGDINPAIYNFHFDFEVSSENETIIEDIGNIFENKINQVFGRMISLSLRHGAPTQFVVEQLQKNSAKDDDMFSFNKVISRILKNYIKEGTKIEGKKCPECSSTDLAYQEGCLKCLNCSYSKC